MPSLPLVTVVIPVFNQRADFLRQCIDSVLAQDYPNLELLVSDNHSNNGASDVIRGYADPRLRVVRPPVHLPMVQHWAFAAFQARGEYLSLMGSDDWAEPDWLSTLMAELLAQPGVSFAFSNLTLRFNRTGDSRPARATELPTQRIPSAQAARQLPEWTSPLFSWWIVGAVMRASDYFAVGGIARYATTHNGDYPLSLGLLTRGDALYVGRALANYRIWDKGEGKADSRRQAIFMEDMVRILACVTSDPPVRALCASAGWPLGRIRRRFIWLTMAWVDLSNNSDLTAEEKQRIRAALRALFAMYLPRWVMFLLRHLLSQFACLGRKIKMSLVEYKRLLRK